MQDQVSDTISGLSNHVCCDIHQKISEMYGLNAMNEEKVIKLNVEFKSGCESVYDEPLFKPTVCNLACKFDLKKQLKKMSTRVGYS